MGDRKGVVVSSLTDLRTIRYVRHEFHGEPEPREGTLLTFVYDIPYFSGCGIFPPYHLVNQIFSSGGTGGGMSPGATWEPFTISQAEHDVLSDAVCNTPITEIQPHARYADVPLKLDKSFNHVQDRIAWVTAVCKKHRDDWHDAIRKSKAPR
jgi:hypothetical protein